MTIFANICEERELDLNEGSEDEDLVCLGSLKMNVLWFVVTDDVVIGYLDFICPLKSLCFLLFILFIVSSFLEAEFIYPL